MGGGQSIFALTPNADIGFTRIADKGSRPRRAPFAGETYIGLTMKGRRIAFATATLTALHLLVFLRLAASGDAILTVDGQKLHIETLGEARPAVVFEAGLGNDSNTWSPVAKFARVVLYDRAGLGRSLPMMNKKFRDNGATLCPGWALARRSLWCRPMAVQGQKRRFCALAELSA